MTTFQEIIYPERSWILKGFFVFLVTFIVLLLSGINVQALESLYLSTSLDSKINQIQNSFTTVLPQKDTIMYTKVPRGLVLSIAEEEFFSPEKYLIKASGKDILNRIIYVLQKYDNDCVIESHTDEVLSEDSIYSYDWELSIARANRIADYIVKVGKISSARVFPLGFGEIMPFKDNVSQKGFRDKRVDFVIFDYDVTR